jgi:hypothetical protein
MHLKAVKKDPRECIENILVRAPIYCCVLMSLLLLFLAAPAADTYDALRVWYALRTRQSSSRRRCTSRYSLLYVMLCCVV